MLDRGELGHMVLELVGIGGSLPVLMRYAPITDGSDTLSSCTTRERTHKLDQEASMFAPVTSHLALIHGSFPVEGAPAADRTTTRACRGEIATIGRQPMR